MKQMFIIYIMIFLTSCASLQPKEDENIVYLPKANKQIELQNLKKAKENKIVIGEKNNLKFEFYYGLRGSYYVVIYQNDKKEKLVDLEHYDVFLEVDINGHNPETIMMAKDFESLYSGFGITRNDKTKFLLKMVPHDSFYGNSFSLDFKANFAEKK